MQPEFCEIFDLRILFVKTQVFENVNPRESVYCAELVFREVFKDIFAVDYRGIGIVQIVNRPTPFAVFVPRLI